MIRLMLALYMRTLVLIGTMKYAMRIARAYDEEEGGRSWN